MTTEITCTPSAHQPSLLIRDLLRAGIDKAPDQEISYAGTVRMTYRQLGERVRRLASALTKLGIKPGDTVAIMDHDSHRYLECFFAVPMMGAVLHTVNVRLPAEQVLYTVNHARDDLVLVNRDFLPILQGIAGDVETGAKYVLLDDGTGATDATVELSGEYEALLGEADPGFAFPDLHEDTRATTFYTTGTTGHPKGVYFSHRQLVLHSLVAQGAFGGSGHGRFNADDVYMPLTPMFHVHAWGVPYVATMLGVKQVYPGRYEPAKLLKLLVEEKVTFSHCVPTVMQMMLAADAAGAVDFSRWKVVIGGAALPASLARAALQRGIDIYTGYGMSETCPLLTLAQLPPELEQADLDTQVHYRTMTGRAVPMVQLRIVDEQMQDVAHDGSAQGEVVVRAPWLTQGYLHDEENSEVLWRGGWLHTGDTATMTADGWLRITDRIKDVIKSGGEWVSSIHLEGLVLQHPGVAECAVIGVPDSKWGERPLPLVVRKAGVTVDEQDIIKGLREAAAEGVIARFAVPEQVKFVDSLPRTSVGKLDKKLMRKQVAADS